MYFFIYSHLMTDDNSIFSTQRHGFRLRDKKDEANNSSAISNQCNSFFG